MISSLLDRSRHPRTASGAADSLAPVIELCEVTKQCGTGAGAVRALTGVSLRVAAGEVLAIRGPTGAGKTTLLHVIAGICQPTSGTVIVLGQHLENVPEEARPALRRGRVRTVFESTELLLEVSVLDNLALRLSLRAKSIARVRQTALAALRAAGIDHRAEALVRTLSGGERQRAAIAHALITRPRIVLVDEPGRNLDWRGTEDVVARLRRASASRGTTIVAVMHDIRSAAHADRIVSLVDGIVVADVRTHAPAANGDPVPLEEQQR